MAWVRQCEPRDRLVASKIAAGFITAASMLAVAFVPLTAGRGAGAGTVALAYALPLSLAVSSVALLRFHHRAPRLTWLMIPLLCLVVLVILDIVTHDATAGTQMFILLPALYAGSQLRPAAAYGTAFAAAISEACVVLAVEDTGKAITDLSYAAGILVAVTALLVSGAEGQARLVDELRRQADIDALTGLWTRRVMIDALDASLASAEPAGTSVMLIDVDRFKDVNDSYGHLVGDDTLIHLARILEAVFGPQGTVCRLGGDELAVVLPRCPYALAVSRGEDLLATVRASPLPLPGGGLLSYSISVGVAHVSEDLEGGARELVSLADAALYQAKRSGRGRVGSLSVG